MLEKSKSNSQTAIYAGGAIILAAVIYNVAVAPTLAPSEIRIEQY